VLIGEKFRKLREQKGLSGAQVAHRIGPGFQESLLWDFENGDDNDIDGWSIQEFKACCIALDVSPTDYADIPLTDLQYLSLPELVQRRREEKGFTPSDLSDRIGYEESVIDAIEGRRQDVTV